MLKIRGRIRVLILVLLTSSLGYFSSRQDMSSMQDCIIAMQSLLTLMRLKGIADTVLDYSEPDLAPTKHESGLHKIDN